MSEQDQALQEWAGQSETFVFNIVKAYDDALGRIVALEAALGQLRRPHLIVEDDPWFSCPASGQCLPGYAISGPCVCGAAAHNAIIDAALLQETPDA